MTSPSEIPTNGSTVQNTDSEIKTSPPNTPKAKNVQMNGGKVNGHHHSPQSSPGSTNGNGVAVGDKVEETMSLLGSTLVEGPVRDEEGDTRQNGMDEEQNDEMPSSPGPKRDLYVGNLYLYPSETSKADLVRHPRVQPHVLKDLFGGEKEVEAVKIVPDRNVSCPPNYKS